MKQYKRAEYKKAKCRNCANKQELHIKIYKKIEQSAKKRNKEFNIDINYLKGLIDGSRYKCSLTGVKLTEETLSIDRINSNIGYVEGNIQVVHKNVNIMKNKYSEKEFIKACSLVSKLKTHEEEKLTKTDFLYAQD